MMPAVITGGRRRRAAQLRGSADRRAQHELMAAIAPQHPPCFQDRPTWLTLLTAIQGDPKCPRSAKPIAAEGEFNPEASFCRGCTPGHRMAVGAAKCKPDWLKLKKDQK